jgi:hypothetical protein
LQEVLPNIKTEENKKENTQIEEKKKEIITNKNNDKFLKL